MSFNGVNNYVDMKELKPSQMTITAWIKTDKDGAVVDRAPNPNPPYSLEGWRLSIERKKGVFGIGDGHTQSSFAWSAQAVGTSIINDNRWHHIAGTFDGTTARIYIDGNEENSATGTLTYINTRDTYLGATSYGVNKDIFFNGLIDEVSIYDRALSAVEIKLLYEELNQNKTV